jgi:hypothetical protein
MAQADGKPSGGSGGTRSGVRSRVRRAAQALRGVEPKVPPHPHPKLTNEVHRLREQLTEMDQRLTALQTLAGDLKAIRTRLRELDADVVEQRGLGLRIAELADVVARLLAEAARGDQAAFQKAVAEFAAEL